MRDVVTDLRSFGSHPIIHAISRAARFDVTGLSRVWAVTSLVGPICAATKLESLSLEIMTLPLKFNGCLRSMRESQCLCACTLLFRECEYMGFHFYVCMLSHEGLYLDVRVNMLVA